MTVEALLDPLPRSLEAQTHVDTLIELTRKSAISKEEKESMLGSLRWLRCESINQAGKRMVTMRLGSQTYGERSAPSFFTFFYQMRSNLVHGNLPFPTLEEVGNVTGTLEVFVADLLTNPFLGSST